MARGFHFHLSTHGPDDLTVEKAKETAHGLGQRLSEVEHELLHVAVEAAKSIVAAIGHPASVEFHGVDSLTVPGDNTAVSVTVSTPVTVSPGPAPVTEVMSSSTEVAAPAVPDSEPSVDTPASVDTPSENVVVPVETPSENVEVANGETVVEPTQSPA